MKFSLEIYLKLIELVRANPCLYNTSLVQYRDKPLQQHIWRKIAVEMNDPKMSWADWRQTWRQKRDEFTRRRKRELLSLQTGPTAQEIKKAPLYDQMNFLIAPTENKSPSTTTTTSTSNVACPLSMECSLSDVEEEWNNDGSRGEIEPASPRSLLSDTPSTSRESFSNKRAADAIEYENERKKAKKVSKIDDLIAQLYERSSKDTDIINHMARNLVGRERKGDIYCFLSSRMSEFSKSTQDWMEDEVLKLYLEAKRRDRESHVTTRRHTPIVYSSPAKYECQTYDIIEPQ